jgi:3-dehydroquinate synthase
MSDIKTTRLAVVLPGSRNYDIRVGSGLISSISEQLKSVPALEKVRQLALVCDSSTASLFAPKVRESLDDAGFATTVITIPAGEKSKSLEVCGKLWQALAEAAIGKDGAVIALGGGVVGDISGFVASCWMRGVPWVQLPTSLLAMVDSSVGGKTAINLPAGKNLVGSFHQPAYVLCDIDLLDSLPAAEWQNGMAEIAKTSIIASSEFYHWLVENTSALNGQNRTVLSEAIIRALRFKAGVVVKDERESGLRECLNYGHTFAHALESSAGLGVVGHGRAVVEGIRFASRLAIEAIDASLDFASSQEQLLSGLKLVTPLPPSTLSITADQLYNVMLADKKTRDRIPRFVFATAPGIWQVEKIDADLLKLYLLYWQESNS